MFIFSNISLFDKGVKCFHSLCFLKCYESVTFNVWLILLMKNSDIYPSKSPLPYNLFHVTITKASAVSHLSDIDSEVYMLRSVLCCSFREPIPLYGFWILFIQVLTSLSALYRSYHDGQFYRQRKPVDTVGQDSVL